jgi:hypothetical protein
MKRPDAADLIDVLACDIGARPRNAPSFQDVAPYIRSVQRHGGVITVLFDTSALGNVEALIDAERLCCADLSWDLQRKPEVRLTIGATRAQLDVLAQMLTLPS